MSLIKNKEGTNFYPITVEGTDWNCEYLWSTHRGCPFDCTYCSSKKHNVRFGGDPCEVRRLKGEWDTIEDVYYLKRKLPEGGIFVNPYTDIFTFPKDDIQHIFTKIEFTNWDREIKPQRYIFQTKDPKKYFDYIDLIPEGSWLGTTIDCSYMGQEYMDMNFSKAPEPIKRVESMMCLKSVKIPFNFFVTIEPIMEFNYLLLNWINAIQPDLVFIGANTSSVSLPEPTPDELVALIEALRKITTAYLKSNLERLLPKGFDINV